MIEAAALMAWMAAVAVLGYYLGRRRSEAAEAPQSASEAISVALDLWHPRHRARVEILRGQAIERELSDPGGTIDAPARIVIHLVEHLDMLIEERTQAEIYLARLKIAEDARDRARRQPPPSHE